MKRFAVLSCFCFSLLITSACERYAAPPRPSIVGIDRGVLTDSRAPLVIDFGTPIDAATLRVRVAFNETDIEGSLRDEDADPNTTLREIPVTPVVEGARVTLNHDSVFPVGPLLVLVVEPGLRSTTGETLNYRAKLPFSFGVTCSGGPTRFAGGRYFMLLDVDIGLTVQIQIFADLAVDQASGTIRGRFTSGQRRLDQTCPTPCAGGTLCRLLPEARCVLPSIPAGSVDEYTDYYANPNPPTGFEFLAEGCASDNETGTGVLMAPTTLTVQSPPVTVFGLGLTANFVAESPTVTRASGSLTADSIILGTSPNPITNGTGTMSARSIP